jgi:hypothetical protein
LSVSLTDTKMLRPTASALAAREAGGFHRIGHDGGAFVNVVEITIDRFERTSRGPDTGAKGAAPSRPGGAAGAAGKGATYVVRADMPKQLRAVAPSLGGAPAVRAASHPSADGTAAVFNHTTVVPIDPQRWGGGVPADGGGGRGNGGGSSSGGGGGDRLARGAWASCSMAFTVLVRSHDRGPLATVGHAILRLEDVVEPQTAGWRRGGEGAEGGGGDVGSRFRVLEVWSDSVVDDASAPGVGGARGGAPPVGTLRVAIRFLHNTAAAMVGGSVEHSGEASQPRAHDERGHQQPLQSRNGSGGGGGGGGSGGSVDEAATASFGSGSAGSAAVAVQLVLQIVKAKGFQPRASDGKPPNLFLACRTVSSRHRSHSQVHWGQVGDNGAHLPACPCTIMPTLHTFTNTTLAPCRRCTFPNTLAPCRRCTPSRIPYAAWTRCGTLLVRLGGTAGGGLELLPIGGPSLCAPHMMHGCLQTDGV